MKQILVLFILHLLSIDVYSQETVITPLRNNALDCAWGPGQSNRIAYSMKGPDTYYDIYLMDPDGGNDTCITCNHPLLPNRHISNMAWHPSGNGSFL